MCLLNAMYHTYKWYALHAKHKNISVKNILINGKYKPKYINPDESPFDIGLTGQLNRWVIIIYASMGGGVCVAIISKFIS